MNETVHIGYPGKRRRTGHRFDAANALGDTRLGGDSAQANIAGAPDMGAAAQFHGPVAAHGQHAHVVSVFFAEEGDGALLDGFVVAHAGNADIGVCENLFVDQRLDCAQFLRRHRLTVRKIEAQVSRIHQRSHLAHMGPEYLSQRGVQKMGRGVVGHDEPAPRRIHRSLYTATRYQAAGSHRTDVQVLLAGSLGVLNLESRPR